ncbi:MAG: hypothetical protein ACRDUX_32125 [Mycobacterium sp.]
MKPVLQNKGMCMNFDYKNRSAIVLAGGATLIVVGILVAACSNNGEQSPTPSPTTTTTTTTSQGATPAPTEKNISPTGGNLFTPPVKATPAPNIPGGQHHGINGIP